MPTERQPTSEFHTKNPGANASPPISVQPAGSMRKQNMSCSPPYRPVAPLKPLRRRLEVDGELLDHGQQVGVVQPGVAGGVDRAELAAQGEQLQGLLALRQASRANTRAAVSGVSRLTVSLATPESRQSWPKLQSFICEGPVVAGVEHQPLAGDRPDAERPRRLPDFQRTAPSATGSAAEAPPATESISSGVRRKSSCEARVRLVMTCPLLELNG